MQPSRKQKATGIDLEVFDIDHPFVRWYASFWRLRSARYVSRGQTALGMPSGDIFMGETTSRRFSLGVDDDNIPVLGVSEADIEAFMSLNWVGGAFLRRVQRRDWVALSCPDARMAGSSSPGAVPIRLWLPVTYGLLDGWVGAADLPETLRMAEITVEKGKPEPTGRPLASLPLTFKGDWSEEIKAA
jgi:hypothetical protein